LSLFWFLFHSGTWRSDLRYLPASQKQRKQNLRWGLFWFLFHSGTWRSEFRYRPLAKKNR